MIELMQKGGIIILKVMHLTTHASIALAEPQVIRRIGLGRFALGPIPVAAFLKVDHKNSVLADRSLAVLNAQIIDTAHGFLEHLRPHDSRSDRHDHAFIQLGILKASVKREGEAARAEFRAAIDAGVDEAIQRMGVARSDDLNALAIRLNALERKLAAK